MEEVERKWRETPPGMRVLGLNALVTGSSRGFGRLIAIALAREGANVVVHYNANREGRGSPMWGRLSASAESGF